MKVGYARVSKEEQNLEPQLLALRQVGCDVIYSDHGVSGALFARDGLARAMRKVRKGDTLVVWKLDRLGRSLSGLVKVINSLGARGGHFISLSESINTGTAGGMLLFHLMAALAEFERALISERTKAGLAAAKDRGRQLGRPQALSHSQQLALAQSASDGRIDLQGLAAQFQVHPRTLRRYLEKKSKDPINC